MKLSVKNIDFSIKTLRVSECMLNQAADILPW